MLNTFLLLLFQRGFNQRSPGDAISDNGFETIGFWLLVGIVFLIYKVFFDEERKIDRKTRKRNKEKSFEEKIKKELEKKNIKESKAEAVKISKKIKNYMLNELPLINETSYEEKYKPITNKVSECIAKNHFGSYQISLFSMYIFVLATGIHSSNANELNKKIQEFYQGKEFVLLDLLSDEHIDEVLYKDNNRYLLEVTDYLLNSDLHKILPAGKESADILRKKMLELKQIYSQNI